MEERREVPIPPTVAPSLNMAGNPHYYPMHPVQPIMTPPGLDSLYAACRNVYPHQTNPLQVAAVTKFWMGGPDPLDFISMYSNEGDKERDIAEHWHYISFGLTDLYGDERVHEKSGPENPSGFGFELTFRLKKEPGEKEPPTWPATVMQSLAKYVFQSENILCPGDHVSWHCSLDNSDSRIQHMLMTEDAQLGNVQTPLGSVTFVQIVGVCLEELQAAQQWTGPGVIQLMKSVPGAGGEWLITDMRRGESIFELDPVLREAVDDGIEAEGSNLSGVTAKCSWSTGDTNGLDVNHESEEKEETHVNSVHSHPIVSMGHVDVAEGNRSTLSPTCTSVSRMSRTSCMSVTHDGLPENVSRMSIVHDNKSQEEPAELIETRFLDSLKLTLNYEAGNILPLAIRGRLKHGRHFTFKTVTGDLAITFLTESVTGSYATLEQPYAIHGFWLQVLIPKSFMDHFNTHLQELTSTAQADLPKTFKWPQQKLSITIVPDDDFS